MFVVHGDWRIFVKDDYVLQWFSGCWNEEAAIAYCQEFREKTEELKGKKWALLSFFDGWELGVPEIEPHVLEHCQLFKKNGCIKDCHIYTPAAAKSMQLEKMVPQSEGDYERQVFGAASAAVAWMKEHRFDVDISEFIKNLPAQGYADTELMKQIA